MKLEEMNAAQLLAMLENQVGYPDFLNGDQKIIVHLAKLIALQEQQIEWLKNVVGKM